MSKYGAKRTQVDGVWFASKREAEHYQRLKMWERVGWISGLTLQPEFPLIVDGSQVRGIPRKGAKKGPPLKYVADFAYFQDGRRKVVDVKGMDTPVSRLKRALVSHIYHCDIEVVR